MSERSTAVIAADLLTDKLVIPLRVRREAADRLAELDAELKSYENWRRRVPQYVNIDALRPPCPTCGGKGPNRKDSTYHDEVFPSPCPDCVDGKVSIERLAALWDAIHNDDNALRMATAYPTVVRILRAVRP